MWFWHIFSLKSGIFLPFSLLRYISHQALSIQTCSTLSQSSNLLDNKVKKNAWKTQHCLSCVFAVKSALSAHLLPASCTGITCMFCPSWHFYPHMSRICINQHISRCPDSGQQKASHQPFPRLEWRRTDLKKMENRICLQTVSPGLEADKPEHRQLLVLLCSVWSSGAPASISVIEYWNPYSCSIYSYSPDRRDNASNLIQVS